MRRARDLDDYVARPYGLWFGGPTAVHFFSEPTLCGTLFFGRPDASAIDALTGAIATELPSRSPIHRAFVDTTHLRSIVQDAFHALAAYVGPRAAELGANVSRQAIVHAGGAIGALVAGFYDVTPSATPERTRFFEDAAAALAWLEVEHPRALLRELDAIRVEASGARDELQALRDWVVAHPRAVRVAAAAAALGMTPRALQERLRRRGTTFRREVSAARVRAAQERLAASDVKLSAVALEVGCGTLQHFTTLFRRQVGETPSAWRARHRR